MVWVFLTSAGSGWVPRGRGERGARAAFPSGPVSARNPFRPDAFPPGSPPVPFLFRPSAGAARRPRRGAEGAGSGGVAGSGLPGALLQPCFSLRRIGDSMWRRPAWQVGPCGAAAERGASRDCPATGLRSAAVPGRGGAGRAERPGALARPCPLGLLSGREWGHSHGSEKWDISGVLWEMSFFCFPIPAHGPEMCLGVTPPTPLPALLLGWSMCWNNGSSFTAFPLAVLRVLCPRFTFRTSGRCIHCSFQGMDVLFGRSWSICEM